MAYIDDVLAAVRAVVPVDATRVSGLSNGGAMSHRLACQRADVVAAVVAVGAGNQFAAAGGVCADGVAVLDIHGTADPCWPYGAGGNGQCAGIAQGRKVDVATSTEAWRLRNGCDADTDEESLPDADPTDGTQSTRTRWKGCRHATELIRVEGGGHTWPGGQQYLSADTVGPVPRDFGNALVASMLLREFLDARDGDLVAKGALASPRCCRCGWLQRHIRRNQFTRSARRCRFTSRIGLG
jgi:polyhydroxybutyrate depolymerase